MINAEKLLGQVLGGVLGTGHGKHGKHGKGKNKLMQELTSGAGLMTAIGLAVGAYEVLKDKKSGGAMAIPGGPPPPPSPVPNQTGSPAAVPPPVPPPRWTAAPPAAPVAAVPAAPSTTEDVARRMIQVMVAAAHADGTMDEREERAILDKLRSIDLSQEERMFLLDELHHPKDIASLVAGITDPGTAKAMYMLAFSAVEVDTESERSWLNDLAAGLGLSPAVQGFIEEQNR